VLGLLITFIRDATPKAISQAVRPNRDFKSFVPNIIITKSSGAWVFKHGNRYLFPFLCAPSIGSSKVDVLPFNPSAII
jgi:hypothetical protein